MEHQEKKNLKGMVRRCVPSPGCHLTGVLGLHPFDSIKRELVPWCHSAVEFHLYRLVSVLVPMAGLLCCSVFRGFPKHLLQCELSFLPALLTSLLPSRCCVLGWRCQPVGGFIKEKWSQVSASHCPPWAGTWAWLLLPPGQSI